MLQQQLQEKLKEMEDRNQLTLSSIDDDAVDAMRTAHDRQRQQLEESLALELQVWNGMHAGALCRP